MVGQRTVFYTGVGSHPSGLHTVRDFLRRIRHEFHPQGGPYVPDQLDFENSVLPRDFATFTLDQWVRFSGAVVQSRDRSNTSVCTHDSLA
jgi:hypothetical protein